MRTLAVVALVALAPLAGCLLPEEPVAASTSLSPDAGVFSATHVFPGEYVLEGRFSKVLADGPLGFLPQEIEVLASEFDGEPMEIGFVRPDVPEGERVPVIVFASPYILPLEKVDFRKRLERLTDNFVPHGYAVALVPVRGTANHGGCMDLMGPAERADLDQAITWLGEQPWSNGRIGMVGVSYDGSTPWEVASMGNPYLKTIVPISGVNDPWHLMYRNGTAEGRGLVVLNALYYQYAFATNNPVNGRDPEHVVTGVACPEMVKGFEAATHATLTGERDPFGFWAARDSRPGVEANYQGSIFLVQGLQDWNVDPAHNVPWATELEAKGLVVKYLLGQWGHAWPDSNPEKSPHARWDWAEILLRWFDRELKEDATVDVGPKVQVEDSSGRWRSDTSWPPADAWPVTFHLSADGALAEEPGASGRIPIAGPVEEPVLGKCAGCAVFATDAFDAEMRFAGMPRLPLTVVPSGPAGHVTAYLFVDDGGDMKRVGWGQIDLRFAEGGEKMKPVVPGQPVVARLELEPLDVVVPEGARLVLAVSQGSYGDHLPSLTPAPLLLEVGGDASTLTVHAFERAEDAFFVPPGKK